MSTITRGAAGRTPSDERRAKEQALSHKHTGTGSLFTSEAVAAGHPDKVADQISDAVLDHCLMADRDSRVACETLVTTDLVIVAGEITSRADLHVATVERVVRETIREIGYTEEKVGFAADSCNVYCHLHTQSGDIARGVDTGGAGDQGLMFGYACDETPVLMPLAIHLSHRILERVKELRITREVPWLRPDAKSQVTLRYDDGKPVGIHAIVLSAQHSPEVIAPGTDRMSDEARSVLRDKAIKATIDRVCPDLWSDNIIFHINPTGRFEEGGPHADCGLTGRKIIVDTYGGAGRHGGGAFSGKDPTKVDRSASYMARHVAKNIVAAGLASRCELQLSYAIGVAEPVSVRVDTFGTGKSPEHVLERAVREVFDLTPRGIIKYLDLLRPIYRKAASHGHFGRELPEFTWERTNRVDDLRRAAGG